MDETNKIIKITPLTDAKVGAASRAQFSVNGHRIPLSAVMATTNRSSDIDMRRVRAQIDSYRKFLQDHPLVED